MIPSKNSKFLNQNYKRVQCRFQASNEVIQKHIENTQIRLSNNPVEHDLYIP